jgi:hypothetical protein
MHRPNCIRKPPDLFDDVIGLFSCFSRVRRSNFIGEKLWVPSEASKGGLRNEAYAEERGDQRQTVLELDYVRKDAEKRKKERERGGGDATDHT